MPVFFYAFYVSHCQLLISVEYVCVALVVFSSANICSSMSLPALCSNFPPHVSQSHKNKGRQVCMYVCMCFDAQHNGPCPIL